MTKAHIFSCALLRAAAVRGSTVTHVVAGELFVCRHMIMRDPFAAIKQRPESSKPLP